MTPYEFRHTPEEMFSNTYTEIPNEYISKLPLLTAGQATVLLYIARKTLGFHKSVDTIAVTQIALETGMNRPHCHKIINELIDLKLVKLVKKGENGKSSIYALEKTEQELSNLDRNFTKFPNEILDKWLCHLTGNQFKVLAVFVRCILGYHKTVDSISISYVSVMSGIERSNTSKIIKQLIELGCVKVVSLGDRKNPTVYTLINITDKLMGVVHATTPSFPLQGEDSIWKANPRREGVVIDGVITTGCGNENQEGVVINEQGCGNKPTGGVVTGVVINEQGVVENTESFGEIDTESIDFLGFLDHIKNSDNTDFIDNLENIPLNLEPEKEASNPLPQGVVTGVVINEQGVVINEQGVVENASACGNKPTGGVVKNEQGVWLKTNTQNICTNKEERKEEIKEERKEQKKEEKKENSPFSEIQVNEKQNISIERENVFTEIESMKNFNPSLLVREIYSLCDKQNVPIIKNRVQDGNLLMNNHSAFLYGDMTPRKLLDRVLKHYYIIDFYKNYHSEEIEKQYDKQSLVKYVGVPLSIKSAMNGWGASIEAFYEAIKPIREAIDIAKERELLAKKRREEEEENRKFIETEHKKLVRAEERARREKIRIKQGLPPEILDENGYRTYQEDLSKKDFDEIEFTDTEWDIFSANLCRDDEWFIDGHKGLSHEILAFMVEKMDAMYPDPPPKENTEFDFVAALENLKFSD
jgi:phage replication O-like protein O